MWDYLDAVLFFQLSIKIVSVNSQLPDLSFAPSVQEQSPSNATSLAMMQEPQEVVEETVTIEEDPGTPTSHVSVVTSDDGTTRRTETKVRHHSWVAFYRERMLLILMSYGKVTNKYQKKSYMYICWSLSILHF